jgi:hypothetical protein
MEIRRDLKAQHLYDGMRENWQEVEKAIAEGCTSFMAHPSREERGGKLLWRVLPVRWTANGWEPWAKR